MLTKYLFVASLLIAFVEVGATQQKSQEQILVNLPTEKVWQRIGNFHDLSWHPGVNRVAAPNQNNKKGNIRIIILKDGGIINEKLKKYQADKMRYDYKITDMSTVKVIKNAGKKIAVKVLPVSDYSASIQVIEKTKNQSEVIWKGSYSVMDNPPKELNADAAQKAVSGVFRAGLDNLKTILEKSDE